MSFRENLASHLQFWKNAFLNISIGYFRGLRWLFHEIREIIWFYPGTFRELLCSAWKQDSRLLFELLPLLVLRVIVDKIRLYNMMLCLYLHNNLLMVSQGDLNPRYRCDQLFYFYLLRFYDAPHYFLNWERSNTNEHKSLICSFAATLGVARSRIAALAMSLLLPYRTIEQIERAGNDQDHDNNISETHRTSPCIYSWYRTVSHHAVRSSKCCNGSHRPDHDQYFTDIPARSSLVISGNLFNDQLPTQALNSCKFLCRSSSVTPK